MTLFRTLGRWFWLLFKHVLFRRLNMIEGVGIRLAGSVRILWVSSVWVLYS